MKTDCYPRIKSASEHRAIRKLNTKKWDFLSHFPHFLWLYSAARAGRKLFHVSTRSRLELEWEPLSVSSDAADDDDVADGKKFCAGERGAFARCIDKDFRERKRIFPRERDSFPLSHRTRSRHILRVCLMFFCHTAAFPCWMRNESF